MPLFPTIDDNALFLSQTDSVDPLSSFSEYPFELDEGNWLTVTHYFQAMKFHDLSLRKTIEQAETARKARKMGRRRWHKPRNDWYSVRNTVMTRALYTKAKAHPSVAEALLATQDRQLIESNAYDYYWGCGRDRRGLNHYGKLLMNVRHKLQDEQAK